VMTDLPHDRFCRLPIEVDGYGGANHPTVLMLLAGDDREIGSLDVVLMRRGGGSPRSALAVRDDLEDHPRVQRARHHRHDVRVLGDERGFVTIGQGLLGRTEVSIELTASGHGRGAGRRLLAAAVDAVPSGQLVFGQVAPGNAASLRVFLACGFVPIGSEVLITQRASSSGFQKPGSGVPRPEA
jgi:GNAT superfamily N-acetyltransferase